MVRYCRGCGTVLILGENWTLAQQKARVYTCPSCLSAYHKVYAETHGEQLVVEGRRYRKANFDKERARVRRWRRANPKKTRAQCRRYRESHREQVAVQEKSWRAANPEKARTIGRRAKAKRRARLVGATIGFVDCEALFERDNYRCVYCGSVDNLTLDHIIPLSRGGAHTEENLVTACRHCNASKGVKPLIVWLYHRSVNSGIW